MRCRCVSIIYVNALHDDGMHIRSTPEVSHRLRVVMWKSFQGSWCSVTLNGTGRDGLGSQPGLSLNLSVSLTLDWGSRIPRGFRSLVFRRPRGNKSDSVRALSILHTSTPPAVRGSLTSSIRIIFFFHHHSFHSLLHPPPQPSVVAIDGRLTHITQVKSVSPMIQVRTFNLIIPLFTAFVLPTVYLAPIHPLSERSGRTLR